jgi:hypothetical protein
MGRVTVDLPKFTKTNALLARITELTRGAGGSYVSIGIHSGAGDYEGTETSVAQVGFWMEYGAPRAHIPERSFMRQTFIENKARIEELRNRAIVNVLSNGWTVYDGLAMIGTNVVIMIQNRIRAGIMPENAPSTLREKIAKKQGTTPLIRLASEKLIRSITYQVHIQ